MKWQGKAEFYRGPIPLGEQKNPKFVKSLRARKEIGFTWKPVLPGGNG